MVFRVIAVAIACFIIGCAPPKHLRHDSPIVFRKMRCNAIQETCTCDHPVLAINGQTGEDEVLCNPSK